MICERCDKPDADVKHRFQPERYMHSACLSDLLDEQRGVFAMRQIADCWDIDGEED